MDFLYQALGVIALLFTVLSFQFKNNKAYLIFQLFACTIWSIHFSLGSAWTGVFINAICVLRSILLYFSKNRKTGFIFSSIIALLIITQSIISITIFNEIVWISIMCSTISTVQTYVIATEKKKLIRYYQIFFLSPAYLINAIVYKSIGAIICEIFSIVSSIIALIRWHKEKN